MHHIPATGQLGAPTGAHCWRPGRRRKAHALQPSPSLLAPTPSRIVPQAGASPMPTFDKPAAASSHHAGRMLSGQACSDGRCQGAAAAAAA